MRFIKPFEAYFYRTPGRFAFSLGIAIIPSIPQIEIHLPFGFLRIGWQGWCESVTEDEYNRKRVYGLVSRHGSEPAQWGSYSFPEHIGGS